jgi:hypothetical protein
MLNRFDSVGMIDNSYALDYGIDPTGRADDSGKEGGDKQVEFLHLDIQHAKTINIIN